MNGHGFEVDVDGLPVMGHAIRSAEADPVQVTLTVDGIPMVGVEIQTDGSYKFGYFPPDKDEWVVVHTWRGQ